jgi:hypothetical protein
MGRGEPAPVLAKLQKAAMILRGAGEAETEAESLQRRSKRLRPNYDPIRCGTNTGASARHRLSRPPLP